MMIQIVLTEYSSSQSIYLSSIFHHSSCHTIVYLSLTCIITHTLLPVSLSHYAFLFLFLRKMISSKSSDDTFPLSFTPFSFISRSSSCSMVLDYRTVSTVHAILYYNVRVPSHPWGFIYNTSYCTVTALIYNTCKC